MQIFRFQVAVAFEIDLGDDGEFLHLHHQHIAVAGEADLRKEVGFIQGINGLGAVCHIKLLAGGDRQISEDRAGGNPLQTFNTNIGDPERFGMCREGEKEDCGTG